jgi:hypothetical protein
MTKDVGHVSLVLVAGRWFGVSVSKWCHSDVKKAWALALLTWAEFNGLEHLMIRLTGPLVNHSDFYGLSVGHERREDRRRASQEI